VWNDDELLVLLAIFVSQPFSAGDDSADANARIARAFGRTAGAIDLQWRNVKHHLYRLDLYGIDRQVGQNVMDVIDRYRTNLAELRRDALETVQRNGWDLEDLLG
jgi:hypothetical protein